jgi:hypothetical protein
MVRPDRDKIGSQHPVEIEECYVDGASVVHHKSLVIDAVEVRTKQLVDEIRGFSERIMAGVMGLGLGMEGMEGMDRSIAHRYVLAQSRRAFPDPTRCWESLWEATG